MDDDSVVPVNWESLDALVMKFAQSENLLVAEEAGGGAPLPHAASPPPTSPSSPSSSSSSSSSSYFARLANRQIRRALEAGDIDAAIELLRSHAPSVLDDHRILFRLQKQKFIELLRKGTAEDRDAAIECLRTSLAPCALDAYPEAYEEFKHVLLAFIYDKDDQSSPVADEWSEKKRFDIAGLMSSVLRAHLQVYDPLFSMTLRYLISIHREFLLYQGISSPISDLTERLLLKECDPPTTVEESLYEVPAFDELEICEGDLFLAFQNELCRMKLDIPMLDELVREYCLYRGIIDASLTFPSEIEMGKISKDPKVGQPGYDLSGNCLLELDESQAGKQSDGEVLSNSCTDGCSDNNSEVITREGTDIELRYASEPTSNHEICSTSSSQRFNHSKLLQRNRNRGTGERRKRKRWRGRHDDLIFVPDTSFVRSIKQGVQVAASVSCANTSREREGSDARFTFENQTGEEKYEFLLEMKELASKGMAAEVVEEINTMDPNFFLQNPVLLFQLKQVEFLKLVTSGDHSSALKVACSHLGPLAAKDPALLKPLKETLLALLRPEDISIGKCLPLDALATSLQVAIGRSLGIEEPQLMKIMRATLHTHTEWFKLQMCKDRFESLLRIDFLKDVSSPMVGVAALSKSNTDSAQGSSVVTTSSSPRMADDGSSPTQVSSSDGICDESAILKVMEFLALPRADAIHLLGQYNGNAETVIQQLFA
ncbi:LOW QUALITY PROTEIN: uncharacterized protein LOC104457271 [Eucalyptus grandis]|uniref:LOW QUALITY PROTEIN: uncharacterized protein LOC104457271 n=1 Tax=Eucalyptus grandis TaxID=71139 RepID=UPI00192EB10A|nr:LOW QUALITY PROTEIN: uncharacterized protein LOC104457271 [Eucalyptus grandis]